MNTNEIITKFRTHIVKRCEFSIFNVYFFGKLNQVESDIVAITKSGYAYEYEVKVSRADFLADRRKKKWITYRHQKNHAPKYFYYLLPEGLIKEDEVPHFAGIIECHNIHGQIIFKEVKKPEILNKLKVSNKQVYKLMKKFYYKSL